MTDSTDGGRKAWWRRTVKPGASGIFRKRTMYLRRSEVFGRQPKAYRPPISWSLGLLLFGMALAVVAAVHRRHLDARFQQLVVRSQSAPFEIQRIRQDLAALSLDEKTLEKDLAARLAAADAQKSSEFYLVVDTREKRLSLRLGDDIVRETTLQMRAPRPIEAASGERLVPAPLSGAFTVREKLERPAWKPPAWAWTEAGLPVPSPIPDIRGGLGRYVVVLTDDVILHSPAPPESPAEGSDARLLPRSRGRHGRDLEAHRAPDPGLRPLMRAPWQYRLGFLGSWTLAIIAAGVAALAVAGEAANLSDAARIARLDRIDRLLGSRLSGAVADLRASCVGAGRPRRRPALPARERHARSRQAVGLRPDDPHLDGRESSVGPARERDGLPGRRFHGQGHDARDQRPEDDFRHADGPVQDPVQGGEPGLGAARLALRRGGAQEEARPGPRQARRRHRRGHGPRRLGDRQRRLVVSRGRGEGAPEGSEGQEGLDRRGAARRLGKGSRAPGVHPERARRSSCRRSDSSSGASRRRSDGTG